MPGAHVEVRGPSESAERIQRARTDRSGRYSFPSLRTGNYQVRVRAKGFAPAEKNDLRVAGPTTFDAQLVIEAAREVVNIDTEATGVTPDPAANGSAVVLGRKQIAALSDDPDELAQQLRVLAGPAPGPGGGQIYIDGFLGGNLPPKSTIREVRINANPFSPEYDRPGFGRIEIFTKPGSGSFRGEALAQYNNKFLNARNPLLAQSAPPYDAQLYNLNFSGPVKKNKGSFTVDAERRRIEENALILATTLDDNLSPVRVSESFATPLTRTAIAPRFDYSINEKNTLVVRYQDVRANLENEGVGGFSLRSRAYNQTRVENTAQITETATIGPRAINETRFQFMRSRVQNTGDDATPAIIVQDAFYGGGPTTGNSSTARNTWELTNISTYIRGAHTLKWGGRVRGSLLTDTSYDNFAGTYTFFTLEGYQKTLALERAGYSGSEIVQLGTGPSPFSLNAGTPTTQVNQADVGLFVNDDWRVRPNLTISLGVRYEAQRNIGGRGEWAPRLGIAWGLDGKPNRPPKTVLRAGVGTFYDRIPEVVTLNALRYNGTTQQSYLIFHPDFFPAIPPPSVLQASRQPQRLQPVSSAIAAPRIYQTSVGIERQIRPYARVTATWISTRGVRLLNARNINAPLNGAYPFGDAAVRLLTESAGFSRLNQFVVNPSMNYKRLVVSGFYALSYGRDDTSCEPIPSYSPGGCVPADPYNRRAEWGPSNYGDVRHRMVVMAVVPLPWGSSVMPFFIANSGQPYNITTGLDPYETGFPTARPELLPGVAGSACQGSGLVYAAGFGCFQLSPAPSAPTVGRNSGRGPGTVSLGLRVSRTLVVWRKRRNRTSGSRRSSPRNDQSRRRRSACGAFRRFAARPV
ncbi:MAG: carboxypeptidase regulatory-like domain-containing protein [Acidobacteria bacterium]|nr:carboxypeptidase regulatory-like domain-containing protein [Acidobacteriota bacterium]